MLLSHCYGQCMGLVGQACTTLAKGIEHPMPCWLYQMGLKLAPSNLACWGRLGHTRVADGWVASSPTLVLAVAVHKSWRPQALI